MAILQRQDTQNVLRKIRALEAESTLCFVVNDKKKLYTFQVRKIFPETCAVQVDLPQGRTAVPDVEDTSWRLTVRTEEGAYTFDVRLLEASETHMRFFFSRQAIFVARRSRIRLRPDSRNPTLVTFHLGERQLEAKMVDFSREGIGLLWCGDPEIAVGDELCEGSFRICSQKVHFGAAVVVHVEDMVEGHRLGVRFQGLEGSEQVAVKAAFDACFLSQPYVSSPALDW